MDFAFPTDHKIKLKECKMKNKYLHLVREFKKLWNIKVTFIPFVIGAFCIVMKGLLKGLEDLEITVRVETIQTTALLRTVRILRRVLETWGDMLSPKSQWKSISYNWCDDNNYKLLLVLAPLSARIIFKQQKTFRMSCVAYSFLPVNMYSQFAKLLNCWKTNENNI